MKGGITLNGIKILNSFYSYVHVLFGMLGNLQQIHILFGIAAFRRLPDLRRGKSPQ